MKNLLRILMLSFLFIGISNLGSAQLNCNSNVNASLAGDGNLTLFAEMLLEGNGFENSMLSKDNVNFSTSIDYNCDDIGVHTVYVQAEVDGSLESCTSEVTIEDKLNPIAIAQNVCLELDNGAATLDVVDIDAGSYDNCDFTISLSQSEFTTSDLGQNTVTLTITDDGGNSNQAWAFVNVVEDADDCNGLNCNSYVNVSLNFFGTADINTDMVLEGNSGVNPEISLDQENWFNVIALTCDDIGENTIYVRDIVGGTTYTCTSIVNLEDKSPPVAIANVDVCVLLVNGNGVLLPETVDEGSYDVCGDVTLSLSQTLFTTSDLGEQTVTLTVEDESGNTNQALTSITVTDDSNECEGSAGCDIGDVLAPLSQITIIDADATPQDVDVNDLVANYGFAYEEVHPTTELECDNFVTSYSDIVINVPAGYKIIRTFTTLDWLTADLVEHIQLIKIFDELFTSISCNDETIISLSLGETATINPGMVLEGEVGNLFDYDIDLFEDAAMTIPVPNPVTSDYIGDTIFYEVTYLPADIQCWGTIIIEEGVTLCPVDFENDVTAPLEVITIPDDGLDPATLTPAVLVDQYEFDESDVNVTIDSECALLGVAYEDVVFNHDDGTSTISRTFTAIDWITYQPNSTDGIETYNQTINIGIDQSDLICDFLPRSAPEGDCESGHTLEDAVEWPDDLSVEDYRLTPEELVAFSAVDVLDASPQLDADVDAEDYAVSYQDFFSGFPTTSTVQVDRKWTIIHEDYGFEWDYIQEVLVNFSDFENLVTVNTGSNRVMADVDFDGSVTDENGEIYLSTDINLNPQYQDESLNGINILDLILLQESIENMVMLNQNELLAADINNSGVINAVDVTIFRNRFEEQDNQTFKWRFFENSMVSQTFSNSKNFIAVKEGDIDDSALINGEVEPGADYSFRHEDRLLNQGEVYTVPVLFDEDILMKGIELRFNIDMEKAQILNVTSPLHDEVTYSVNDEGRGVIYFIADEDIQLGSDEVLIEIEFEALENTLLNLSFDFDSRMSYMVDENYELIRLEGEIENEIEVGTNSPELASLSIYPNPTSEILNFDINDVSVKGDIEIGIYNAVGQKMTTKQNTTTIDVSAYNAGMYYYTITIGAYSKTAKFIIAK